MSLDPYIVLYHDFLSDKVRPLNITSNLLVQEIDTIQVISTASLEPATVILEEGHGDIPSQEGRTEDRVQMTAFLQDLVGLAL